MNEIILDTETTGLSHQGGHRIVEIACIEIKDLVPTNKIFHKIINPERDVPQEAFNVHGFSSDFLKGKETFSKIAQDFNDFIKDKTLIIHNAPFDVGFLNFELNKLKMGQLNNKIIDTLELARSKHPGASNSLDALCRRFNIDLSRRKKHNALLDCELLREVYINILGVKEPTLNFKSKINQIDINSTIKSNKYSKKVISLTEEELQNHKQFIKKEFKKNYY